MPDSSHERSPLRVRPFEEPDLASMVRIFRDAVRV